MKIPIMTATFILAASAFAQEQQSMRPIMIDAPAQQHDPSMTGMDMNQQGDQSGKPPAGTDIQKMQGMHMDSPMTQVPANGSIEDMMSLQEPENPTHRTGSNLPAPELLKDVVTRRPKSLADFLRMADQANPTIAQANALVQRSAAQARQAGLYPNPTAGYQGEQIRGGSYGGGEQGGFIQQTIVLGGKLGLRRNIYEQQQRSDQIGVEEQTFRVHNDVAQAFYAALTAQVLVSVRQRLLGVTLDAVETAHQLANVGQADAPDILQSEVEAEQAKVDYVTTQREFLQSFRTLAAMAGNIDLPVSPLQGDLEHPPEIDVEQQVANIIANSPEVRRSQQEVAVAEARLKVARREPVPDLQLRAGEQYNGELVRENPNLAAGAQSFATAGINIPLWNRNQGNTAAATVEMERAHEDVARVQLHLRQVTAPLAQSYESARFEAERYKSELIPRAQRAYELYLTKYRSMAQAYPQVLVSQRTLFQLEVTYFTALRAAWTNAIALQNFTLSGGLSEPQSSGSSDTSINLPGASGSIE